MKTPACPKRSCAGKVKQSYQADIPTDIGAGKAPGVIGSIPVRAFDAAHEIAMADHGMTDIQTGVRPGESTAPKLPPHLQAKADAFWGGGQQQKPQGQRTAKVDMSPLYGERATGTAQAQFRADTRAASLIEPILKHKRTGDSPVPAHTVIAG